MGLYISVMFLFTQIRLKKFQKPKTKEDGDDYFAPIIPILKLGFQSGPYIKFWINQNLTIYTNGIILKSL